MSAAKAKRKTRVSRSAKAKRAISSPDDVTTAELLALWRLLHFVNVIALANDLAQQDPDTAARIITMIEQLDGHPLREDAQLENLAAAFARDVRRRVSRLRSGIVDVSSSTQ